MTDRESERARDEKGGGLRREKTRKQSKKERYKILGESEWENVRVI